MIGTSGRVQGVFADLDENGFTLIEAMVACVIAVIAVMGLAHSFGIGRGLVDRYETARDALALVQQRLERLSALEAMHGDLSVGLHDNGAVSLNDGIVGNESWMVVWVDDAVDGLGSGDLDGPNDYKRATVSITWNQAGTPDGIQLSRTFLLSSP